MDLMPFWTKPSQWSLGRDPLGMQATSVRVYRTLVPGLTNVTNRLRYYSFYCWAVHHYEQSVHADDDAQWRVFIRRAEALYALACEVENPAESDGLAGGDWARDFKQRLPPGKIDLRPYTDRPGVRNAKQYLLAPRGNFGQFYVASMVQVGLLSPSSGVPIVSKTRGGALASAFAAAIGSDVEQLVAAMLKSGTVSQNALRMIGKAVHPSTIRASSKEMALLRDFVLVKEADVDGGTARRSSAWLLLDLVRNGVPLDDQPAIRRAFYHRVLPDGSPYLRTGAVIDRWRAFQANEFCHIALEAWLNATTEEIDKHANGVTPDALLGALVKIILPRRLQSMSWRQWASQANSPDDDENLLAEVVLEGLRDSDNSQNPEVLQGAARLLAVLWCKWSNGALGVRDEVLRFAGTGGRSLAGVLATLDATADTPTTATISEIIRRHILLDHLVIAARKLAASGTFTYHFVLADGLLSAGVSTNYGYTNPRLRNLGRFLRDAKLCERESVTPAGLSFLNGTQPA